ncbi:hypothetical protein [Streptomyces sp. NPDC026092]|uniref:hypothetical protein n=1 Tax=Streptomyces sp. NPDC026092 TaxID=3154797 RepID=UPI0033D1A328
MSTEGLRLARTVTAEGHAGWFLGTARGVRVPRLQRPGRLVFVTVEFLRGANRPLPLEP